MHDEDGDGVVALGWLSGRDLDVNASLISIRIRSARQIQAIETDLDEDVRTTALT